MRKKTQVRGFEDSLEARLFQYAVDINHLNRSLDRIKRNKKFAGLIDELEDETLLDELTEELN